MGKEDERLTDMAGSALPGPADPFLKASIVHRAKGRLVVKAGETAVKM